MDMLTVHLGQCCGVGVTVVPGEAAGWQGDYVEAEAFAVLATRSIKALPLSFPGTTGVPEPTCGGVLHRPEMS